jgi:ribosome biogenesis ATPase
MNASLLNSYKEKAQTIDLGVPPATPPQVIITTPTASTSQESIDTPQPKKKKASQDDPIETKKRRLRSKDSVESLIRGRSGTVPSPIPEHGYEALGGIDPLLEEIRQLAEWPMLYPQLYTELGVKPPRGILLHGPPGCGKTILANAIAGVQRNIFSCSHFFRNLQGN